MCPLVPSDICRCLILDMPLPLYDRWLLGPILYDLEGLKTPNVWWAALVRIHLMSRGQMAYSRPGTALWMANSSCLQMALNKPGFCSVIHLLDLARDPCDVFRTYSSGIMGSTQWEIPRGRAACTIAWTSHIAFLFLCPLNTGSLPHHPVSGSEQYFQVRCMLLPKHKKV